MSLGGRLVRREELSDGERDAMFALLDAHFAGATREQARRSIFEYVEVFYNRRRLHSSLGYQSPEQFEAAMN